MAQPMVRRNINVASHYHEFVIDLTLGDLPEIAPATLFF
jgi:hypothetical protein